MLSRSIHPSNGGYFFMLCALFFLVMAENIHIHYGRLSPAELKVPILSAMIILSLTRQLSVQERAEYIGYATFAILFAVLDIGCVIVRVAGLIALSGSPALAASLVLVSMSASITLPLLTYPARLLKRRKRESGGEVAMESGTVAGGTGTSES